LAKKSFDVAKYKVPIAVAIVLIVAFFGYRTFAAQAERKAELSAKALFDYKSLIVRSYFKNIVDSGLCSGEGIDFDDTSLTIDGKGSDDSSGANDFIAYFCVLKAEMPESTQNKWQKTTALQGRVEDDWKVLDGEATIEASWTYHPRNGVDITFRIDSVYLENFDYTKHASLVEGLTLEGLKEAEEKRKKEKEDSTS
jgi:hypothetical protein